MQLALEKKERLSPSPCMHTASTWGEGTFCLDRESLSTLQQADFGDSLLYEILNDNPLCIIYQRIRLDERMTPR